MLKRLLTSDVAVDITDDHAVVGVCGGGLVAREPLAKVMKGDELIAYGVRASVLAGRLPEGMSVVRPVQAGHVKDRDIFVDVIARCFRRGRGRVGRVLFAWHPEPDGRDLEAMEAAAASIGASSTRWTSRALAVAVAWEAVREGAESGVVACIEERYTEILGLLNGHVHRQHWIPWGGSQLNDEVGAITRDMVGLNTGVLDRQLFVSKLYGNSDGYRPRGITIVGNPVGSGQPVRKTVPAEEARQRIERAMKKPIQAIVDTLHELPLGRTTPPLLLMVGESPSVVVASSLLERELGTRVATEDSGLCVAMGGMKIQEAPDRYRSIVETT